MTGTTRFRSAEVKAWSMAGLRNYRRRSPMPQWQSPLAEVECHRCKTRASIPLDAISDRGTPVWKLEATLKCRSCKKGRQLPSIPAALALMGVVLIAGSAGSASRAVRLHMALSELRSPGVSCPLLRLERTRVGNGSTSAFDPTRTSAGNSEKK